MDEQFYLKNKSLLTKNFFSVKQSVWMSHEDAVVKLPKNFKTIALQEIQNLQLLKILKKKYMRCNFTQK